MNLLLRMAKGLQQFLMPQPRSIYSGPLQVQNLSRGTVLAVRLEAAHTGPSRRKGLLGRAGLEPGEGLWISPCESVHTFFMKFPIDLVYLDRNHQVKKVRNDRRPLATLRMSGGAERAGASCRHDPGEPHRTRRRGGDRAGSCAI